MNMYVCIPCGLVFDEDMGLPEYGIDPGTPFQSLPDTWRCPECGGAKENFALIPLSTLPGDDAR